MMLPVKCPVPESNQRHEDFQSSALPTELTGRLTDTYSTGITDRCQVIFVVNFVAEERAVMCVKGGRTQVDLWRSVWYTLVTVVE